MHSTFIGQHVQVKVPAWLAAFGGMLHLLLMQIVYMLRTGAAANARQASQQQMRNPAANSMFINRSGTEYSRRTVVSAEYSRRTEAECGQGGEAYLLMRCCDDETVWQRQVLL